MATEISGMRLTAEAAADLSAAQFKFVKLNSTDKVALVAAAGVDLIGVLQNDPTSGQWATVQLQGLTKCVAGGTIARGDRVRSTAAGVAVVADSDESCGVARSAAASGEIFSLELLPASRVGPLFLGSFLATAASGTVTLVASDVAFQRIDPNGAARDVNLPTVATSRGKVFFITNTADAAENLVVKNSGGSTIVTLNQNEASILVCDGATWNHMGVITIAQT